jgi:hypothetical protein
MNMARSRWTPCFPLGLFRVCHHRLERLGAARHDLAVDELPADTFLDEIRVDLGREFLRVVASMLAIVVQHRIMDCFDDVVDLVPVGVVDKVLHLAPHVRVLAPVTLIGPHAEHAANDIAKGRRTPIELARRFQYRVAQSFRCILADRDLLA